MPGSVEEAQDVTARSGSVQRMVRRRLEFGDVAPQYEPTEEEKQIHITAMKVDGQQPWFPCPVSEGLPSDAGQAESQSGRKEQKS